MKLLSRLLAVTVLSLVLASPVFSQGLVEYAVLLDAGLVVINTGETAELTLHTSCSQPLTVDSDSSSVPPRSEVVFTIHVTNTRNASCRQTIKVPATLSCGLSTVGVDKGFGFISFDDGKENGPIENPLDDPCFGDNRVRIVVGMQLGPDQADAIAEKLAAQSDKPIKGMPKIELVTVSETQTGNTKAAWFPQAGVYRIIGSDPGDP